MWFYEFLLRRRCESMSTEHLWNNTDREARSAWKKTCSTGTFSTKNVTRNSLEVNSGLRYEKPETNRLTVDGFQWLFQAEIAKFIQGPLSLRQTVSNILLIACPVKTVYDVWKQKNLKAEPVDLYAVANDLETKILWYSRTVSHRALYDS